MFEGGAIGIHRISAGKKHNVADIAVALDRLPGPKTRSPRAAGIFPDSPARKELRPIRLQAARRRVPHFVYRARRPPLKVSIGGGGTDLFASHQAPPRFK